MMLRVELRPLAASIVVVVRQLDPSQVPKFVALALRRSSVR